MPSYTKVKGNVPVNEPSSQVSDVAVFVVQADEVNAEAPVEVAKVY